ncbi:unnamed protein product [Trichobilharzia regenti]|nr:unnamed protein product [Trichobilharzia regenti]
MAGDFNLPKVNWLSGSGSKRFDEILVAVDCCGWKQYIQTPTRGDNMLDLVLCCGVIPVFTFVGNIFSSSCLPISSLNAGNKYDSQSKHVNWEIVQERIRCYHWDDFFTTNTLETVLSPLYRNVTLCPDTLASKKIKLHKHQAKYIPIASRQDATPCMGPTQIHEISYRSAYPAYSNLSDL